MNLHEIVFCIFIISSVSKLTNNSYFFDILECNALWTKDRGVWEKWIVQHSDYEEKLKVWYIEKYQWWRSLSQWTVENAPIVAPTIPSTKFVCSSSTWVNASEYLYGVNASLDESSHAVKWMKLTL